MIREHGRNQLRKLGFLLSLLLLLIEKCSSENLRGPTVLEQVLASVRNIETIVRDSSIRLSGPLYEKRYPQRQSSYPPYMLEDSVYNAVARQFSPSRRFNKFAGPTSVLTGNRFNKDRWIDTDEGSTINDNANRNYNEILKNPRQEMTDFDRMRELLSRMNPEYPSDSSLLNENANFNNNDFS